jgi:phosphatidylglycerophosphate synthase
MFDDRLRRAKDQVLAPVGAQLRSVPPVAITGAGLVAGIGCAAAAYSGDTPLALGLWAANRTLDGLDGTVARLSGTSSDRGGYFDLLADFVTYATIPVAQVAGAPDPGTLAVPLGALLGAYYVNAVSWLALSAIIERRSANAPEGLGGAGATDAAPDHRPLTTIRMPTGLVEGTETVIFVVACLAWPDWLAQVFVGFGALVILTALQRAIWAWQTLGPE